MGILQETIRLTEPHHIFCPMLLKNMLLWFPMVPYGPIHLMVDSPKAICHEERSSFMTKRSRHDQSALLRILGMSSLGQASKRPHKLSPEGGQSTPQMSNRRSALLIALICPIKVLPAYIQPIKQIDYFCFQILFFRVSGMQPLSVTEVKVIASLRVIIRFFHFLTDG
jgi:hypothetical protein